MLITLSAAQSYVANKISDDMGNVVLNDEYTLNTADKTALETNTDQAASVTTYIGDETEGIEICISQPDGQCKPTKEPSGTPIQKWISTRPNPFWTPKFHVHIFAEQRWRKKYMVASPCKWASPSPMFFQSIFCFSGTYADPDDCTKYYSGSNSLPYRMSCSQGTVWNDRIKSCTFTMSPTDPCKSPGLFNQLFNRFNEAEKNSMGHYKYGYKDEFETAWNTPND